MLDDRAGNVGAFPSGPAGAQAEVGILAVQEKRFVEQADFLQHFSPVKGGGSAGEQGILHSGELHGRFEMAALLAGAIGGNQHPGRIEMSCVQTHFGGEHSRSGTRFGGCDKPFEPARIGNRIVIERREIRSFGQVKPLVDGGSEAGVAGIRDDAHTRAAGRGEAGAAVVDYDHFKLVKGLYFD